MMYVYHPNKCGMPEELKHVAFATDTWMFDLDGPFQADSTQVQYHSIRSGKQSR
jgi:hypothetical protein